jgi:protocatechuate 3,4-dioxygenase beta subunit
VAGAITSPPAPFPPPTEELPSAQKRASTNQTCTLTPSLIEVEGTPQQTEGPYFVEGMPKRSDIRADTSDNTLQAGIPLELELHVYSVEQDNNGTGDLTFSCVPLSDARVDVWLANSQGLYSGVQNDGTGGKNFLRGYQVTDNNGTVGFTTIYPGWYEGRAIHIHVKVRTFEGSNETLEWTSQFYLNNTANEEVHTQSPYNDHGPVDMTNEEDFIFRGPSTDGIIQVNTGDHLLLEVMKKKVQGYVGIFNIGLNATQIGN